MAKRSDENREPGAEAPAEKHDRDLVILTDKSGQPLGVTVTLKDTFPEPEEPAKGETKQLAHLRHLTKCIASWSSMTVDGERVPFSQARALSLFQRFPHFADQIDRAIKKDHA